MPSSTDTRAEVEIALKDNLSPALRNMARDIRSLNRTIRDMGDDGQAGMDRVAKSAGGLSGVSKNAIRDLTAMGNFMSGFTKSLIGTFGTAAAIDTVTKAVYNLAQSRVQLSMFAQDSRFAAQDIATMRGAMARMGIDAKQADQYVGGLATKLQELGALKQGSQLFKDLQNMGPGGVNLANNLLGDVNAGNYRKALKDITDVFKEQKPEVQFWMSQALGIPVSVLKNFDEYSAKVGTVVLANEKAMQDYLHNVENVRGFVNDEWTRMASHVVGKLNDMTTAMDMSGHKTTFSDWFNSEFDKTITDANNFYEDISRIGNKIKGFWDNLTNDVSKIGGMFSWDHAKKTFADQMAPYQGGGGKRTADFTFGDMASEQLKTQEDSAKTLQEIRDILQRMGGDAGGGGGGAPSARAGGLGARGGGYGGNLGASLGGFRPGGGVSSGGVAKEVAASLKAAGMSDTGIAAVMGSIQQESSFKPDLENASGHKGLFQWERSRQPKDFSVPGQMSHFMNELKQRDPAGFAKLQDPNTSPDDAMAVMNNFERFKGYQQGRAGAEAGNRYGYMEQFRSRLKNGELQGSDGAGGGAPPAAVLDEAKKAALSGGPGAVYKYIRNAGYNVDYAWCGDFAAAVVKTAGGTPPKNPQIASNWRNYGQEVTNPQPGDIAVRRGARTGSTGSHVTVVDEVNGDRFAGIGGNQRRPRSNLPVGGYQFFRDNIDKAQANATNVNGSASVTVDFKNVPQGVKTNADADGVFKDLKINREPQAPKAGNPSSDNRYSNWYFQ